MSVVKSPIPDADLKIVGEALQGALVDLVDLALASKQVHWNVIGPRFRSIHLQLDEVVATARQHSDTVAERAAALASTPTAGLPRSPPAAPSGAYRKSWIKDADVVQIMVDALGAVISRMRERIGATEEPDPVTQDLLIGLTADLEKHAWMFQAESV